MSYQRTNWQTEDIITADALNNIEEGIANVDTGKVDKIAGKGLSTNDYSDSDKNKLAGIIANADVISIQSDWDVSDSSSSAYIKNKPVNVLLTYENIPNTVQSFVTVDGNVTQILHKRNGSAIRTDALTYGETTITEVRTLANGEKLTISTNLVTLETTITYTAS